MVGERQISHGTVRFWAKCCGILIPTIIPPLHIAVLYYFWSQYSRNVDQRYCSCSCWDTVFKGTYETGIAGYKHMYFNATTQTLKMWVLTVISIIVFYECVRHLVKLIFERRIRFSMFILFATSVFSHYYTWWGTLNYWNDDFYSQWYHQMFFNVTEISSTILVMHLADSRNPITIRKALGISGIAVMHVLLGGFDQFIQNVIRGEGHMHQVIRDLCFMLPDLLNVILPLVELKRTRSISFLDAELRKEFVAVTILVAFGFMICSFL